MLLYFSLSKRAILCLFFNSLGAVASAFGPEAFDAPTWIEAELIVALEDWFSAAHVECERAVRTSPAPPTPRNSTFAFPLLTAPLMDEPDLSGKAVSFPSSVAPIATPLLPSTPIAAEPLTFRPDTMLA